MERLGVGFFISICLALIASRASSSPAIKASTSDAGGARAFNHPPWLGALRELIFKTISPSPSFNAQLYRSFIEAPFYGSANSSTSTSSLVSRGDVYQSKGRWILCQEGCTSCAECQRLSRPSLKWTLRRAKPANSTRRELQLTLVPQLDDSFHMRNLRRRSYVYVVTQSEPGSSRSPKKKRRRRQRSRAKLNGSTTTTEEPVTERRRKKQLRVVPLDLQLHPNFDAVPAALAEVSAGLGKPSGDSSRISLLGDGQRERADSNESLVARLESLYRDYERFLAESRQKGEDTAADPRGIVPLKSAVSRLPSQEATADQQQHRRKKKAAAIERPNPAEDNRLKGTAEPASEESRPSSNSDTRAAYAAVGEMKSLAWRSGPLRRESGAFEGAEAPGANSARVSGN